MTEVNESWSEPLPRTAPRPTYAPFLLAIGIAMGFWGIVTNAVMSLGGLALFVWAFVLWMRELKREWEDPN